MATQNYIIRAFNEDFGQLVIEYGDITFSYDLPIDENNNYPVGEELDRQIKLVLPVWHEERKEKVGAGVNNSAEIRALVVPKPVVQPTQEELILQEATSNSSALHDYIVSLIEERLAANNP